MVVRKFYFCENKRKYWFCGQKFEFYWFEAQKFIFCGHPQLAIFVMRSFWIRLLPIISKFCKNSQKSRLVILVSFLISVHVVVKFLTIIAWTFLFSRVRKLCSVKPAKNCSGFAHQDHFVLGSNKKIFPTWSDQDKEIFRTKSKRALKRSRI